MLGRVAGTVCASADNVAAQAHSVSHCRQRAACRDRVLAPTINQRDAPAFQRHEGNWRHGFGGGGDQRCHLGGGVAALFRPARRLANIGEQRRVSVPEFLGHFAEQRGLPGAGNQHIVSGSEGRAHPLELCTAQLMAGNNLAKPLTCGIVSQRLRQPGRIQRHGLFT